MSSFKPNSLHLITSAFAMLLALGCHSTPKPQSTSTTPTTPQSHYPTRPNTTPPPFRVFHQTENSLTLVTTPTATDEQITAILYQLHDAARSHTFDTLHLPQKFIDARDPFLFFHIYRGPKCAPEKYASGDLPCGNSYHAAGDYTLGDFKDPNRDSGLLRNPDTQQETPLWP